MSDPEYKRGYTAGRKKTEAEVAALRATWDAEELRDRDFVRAVFLVALPEIIRSPWVQDGKKLNTASGIVNTAAGIAEEALRRLPK